ncbi:hypothetical protein OQ252_13195 [Acetobacter farinalis]|uniref:SMODS and SLOG-associating 2TM effector domain-containing protein n=1 Tax=Acetobacter farinalis TaxID=1260984 RepID=A0ABT3QAQ7_9PROT|nr:hypothetical protein [Acetobacter farinalis]MCX2562334.1 hypothetical protein [Acetobacter farinalis]NHO30943.1 hypothetical protein [Acetobacter farinalis]
MFPDLLREMYFYELDFREKSFTKAQFSVATNIAILTGVIYILRSTDNKANIHTLLLLYIPIFIGLVLIILSMVNIFKALTGHKYKLITPENGFNSLCSLQQYNEDIRRYNIIHLANESEVNIESAMVEYFSPEIIECINSNLKINKNRSKNNRLAILFIIYSLIPFLFSAIIFIVFDLDASSPRKDQGIEDKSIENSLRSIDMQLQKNRFPLSLPDLKEPLTLEVPSNGQRQTRLPKSTATATATTTTPRAKQNNNCHRRSERSPGL